MSDPAAIEMAILAALDDAALKALLPDGAYYQYAPQGKTRFAIVQVLTYDDVPEFQDTAFERATYLVKAVTKDTSPIAADNAALRIRELVEAITTIDGYIVTLIERTERMPPYAEPDPANPDALWHHRGGLFDVQVQPL